VSYFSRRGNWQKTAFRCVGTGIFQELVADLVRQGLLTSSRKKSRRNELINSNAKVVWWRFYIQKQAPVF
jgi:hypothetical protein